MSFIPLETVSSTALLAMTLVRADASRPSFSPSIEEQLADLRHSGTGAGAVAAMNTTTSALAAFWKAELEDGEPKWHLLPDRAVEHLQAQGKELGAADLAFLAQTYDAPPLETVAAARILAIAAEEGLVPVAEVRPLLLEFLAHPAAGVRLAAVEAFWQLADREVGDDLVAALDRESNEDVRATLAHVIDLFA